MTASIGDRLRYARERAGLTLQQLCERTKIGISSLSEYESGKREPRLAQLQALAETLHRSIAFFLEPGALPKEIVLWSEKPAAQQAQELEGRFRRLCEQYHNLEVWCGERGAMDLPFQNGAPENFGSDQAEALAYKVLQHLQLGSRPALALLSVLEESCGVKVFHLDFDPAGSAACILSDTLGAGILLNARNVRWRRNFDLAHELFHLLTWAIFQPARRGDVCDQDRDEKLATCFARHLLMPREAVKLAIGDIEQKRALSHDDLFDLARQFDVSMEAVLWHIAFLYNRSEEQTRDNLACCKALFNVWEDREPYRPSVRPARFEALAVKALRSGELSLGRFAEYMGISRREAQRYVQQGPVNEQEVQIASS
jgi:transcriptional regulator with XRE-family HTH domain/Zn-dependent peptidase ImmA (M78 family)